MQPHPSLQLLLIEDDRDLSALLKFTLETICGWQVVIVTSAEKWLNLAESKAPDIILLDKSPGDSDELPQLKKSPLTKNIPVVCLVARDRTADQIQAKEAGASAIIAKPFEPLCLVEIIKDLVLPRPI